MRPQNSKQGPDEKKCFTSVRRTRNEVHVNDSTYVANHPERLEDIPSVKGMCQVLWAAPFPVHHSIAIA